MVAALLAGEPFVKWDWVADHSAEMVDRATQHVQLTVLAVVAGLAISVPLALLGHSWGWAARPLTWLSNALYAIPSLALFGLLIPVTHFTLATALIVLTTYTLSTLVPSILAGLDAVPRHIHDAADGLGYGARSRLWAVDFPLALPVVLNGIRITTVSTIGLVTVASTIGYGGFGSFIADGLDRDFTTPLVVGAVGSVALVVLAEAVLAVLRWWLIPWQRANSPAGRTRGTGFWRRAGTHG